MDYLSNHIICKFIAFTGYTSIGAFILIFLSLLISIGGYQILLNNLKKYNKMQYDYIIYKGSNNWFIRFSKLEKMGTVVAKVANSTVITPYITVYMNFYIILMVARFRNYDIVQLKK